MTFIHGVETSDASFADTATRLLKRAFTRHTGTDADDALVIRPVHWAPALQDIQDKLHEVSFGPPSRRFLRLLDSWSTRLNAGGAEAIWPLLATVGWRRLPGVPRPHYAVLRWGATHFIGDAIAYQITRGDRSLYDEVHGYVARTLRELADASDGAAPLCVIAHSLGTVVTSNYFYDLQVQYTDGGRPLVTPSVTECMRQTPLERGETLTLLYTLGSPLALWCMSLPDFGTPLLMPPPKLREHHPGVSHEWINFQDPDDLLAYPLRPLSDAYRQQVTSDREVSVAPRWVGWTPLAHWWYWNDLKVIDPIARSLARVWSEVNGLTELR
ncbi:hypothetical protein [Streptomyces purpurogeneiscleroticus]|uniref:hypothetical protein n=1 Tax=Streptomyces purpurogeneiscleroticus TaxID=68259 RepID=UPI001CBC7DD9|nr:hypothetical protein [Streptomyces purpurogeneiscleroticus]MBZ4020136.1 hypothetical protein [Streptomyces purpurogeneiscleroticus]